MNVLKYLQSYISEFLDGGENHKKNKDESKMMSRPKHRTVANNTNKFSSKHGGEPRDLSDRAHGEFPISEQNTFKRMI